MSDGLALTTRAARFAAVAHGAQTRKGSGLPYIVHPAHVADMAAGLDYATPELVAAAWLHDTIEDTDVEADELREEFGDRVAGWVVELTNQFTKAAHPDKNRAERKRLEAERLATVSREAKVLKMLDRISNLADDGLDAKFLRVYVQETNDLLDALRDGDPALAKRLAGIANVSDPGPIYTYRRRRLS